MAAFSKTAYELKWIAVRDLAVVWQEAQRPYQEWWAKELAEMFDPDLFDPVKVTLPNGNGIYHICEGQHRTRAVEIMWGPDQQVPCLVAPETDPARAAELFLAANTNRNAVSKIAKFHTSVTAQRKIECDIDFIVRHNGYRVAGTHQQDTIAAVDALKFAYRKGPKTLDRTLRVLRATWSGDPQAVSAMLIKGYSEFICEFAADLDFERLRIRVAKQYTPGKLIIAARGIKSVSHVTVTKAVVNILLEVYNKGSKKPLKRKE